MQAIRPCLEGDPARASYPCLCARVCAASDLKSIAQKEKESDHRPPRSAAPLRVVLGVAVVVAVVDLPLRPRRGQSPVPDVAHFQNPHDHVRGLPRWYDSENEEQ